MGKNENSSLSCFTLVNKKGTELNLTNIGASIISLKLSIDDEIISVVLGYDTTEEYINDRAYMGSVIGRYANRIADGNFTLNGKTYKLDKNQDGKHTLHSGKNPYSSRIWETVSFDKIINEVTFFLHSKDKDQGMPGSIDIFVTYKLSDENEIIIKYKVISDKDTIINPTNHAYFNLNGRGKDMLSHNLCIKAKNFTPIDKDSIPDGRIETVIGTPLDFTTAKPIGLDIESDYPQIIYANGYDHNFVLDDHEYNEPVAMVYSENTGIKMEVYTDMPGIQFYTANFLENTPRGGFCLETQYFPNSPNRPNFPSAILKASSEWESRTVYKFIKGN